MHIVAHTNFMNLQRRARFTTVMNGSRGSIERVEKQVYCIILRWYDDGPGSDVDGNIFGERASCRADVSSNQTCFLNTKRCIAFLVVK